MNADGMPKKRKENRRNQTNRTGKQKKNNTTGGWGKQRTKKNHWTAAEPIGRTQTSATRRIALFADSAHSHRVANHSVADGFFFGIFSFFISFFFSSFQRHRGVTEFLIARVSQHFDYWAPFISKKNEFLFLFFFTKKKSFSSSYFSCLGWMASKALPSFRSFFFSTKYPFDLIFLFMVRFSCHFRLPRRLYRVFNRFFFFIKYLLRTIIRLDIPISLVLDGGHRRFLSLGISWSTLFLAHPGVTEFFF